MKRRNFIDLMFVLVVGVFLIVSVLGYIVSNNNAVFSFTNYTQVMNISVNVSSANVTLIRIYYNSSGGANATLLEVLRNNSANQRTFDNDTKSIDISGLTDGKLYNFSFFMINLDGLGAEFLYNATSIPNVTIDNTAPNVSAFSGELVSNGNFSSSKHGLFEINASVSDTTVGMASGEVWFNITSPNQSMSTFTKSSNEAGVVWNVSVNLSSYPDGTWTIRSYANDSKKSYRNLGNLSASLNNTEEINITIDNTNPTPSASCTSSVQVGEAFPCTCSGSDATSGVNSSATTDSTTSPDATSANPSSTGTFTYTCSITDKAGNTASSSTEYSVFQGGGGASSGSGGTGVITPVGKTQTFTKITPGAVAIVKNFDAETGVKEIEISVSNEAQNVKITVTKYDSKPAVVSVSKTGKVYQYLQINAQNLDNKLEKAKTTFKVEKTWASTNGVAKENVVVSKFDEASSQWNELATTYSSEDDTYYYYTTELSSFSYFAISEKAVAETGEEKPGIFGEEGKGIPVWVWVVVGLIILAIAVGGGAAYKKRK